MATDLVRACVRRLGRLHGRFEDAFGRCEARRHAVDYVRGLLLAEGRKSVEPMALRFTVTAAGKPPTQNEVLTMQRFLTASPWEAGEVMRELQAVFAEEFAGAAKDSPIGVVGIIDESGFAKKGTESVGVQRQWCGRLGKEENCQVGVFLVGSTPAATLLLDHQLYLPQTWAGDARRRKKTRVPPKLEFLTKPQIAAELLRRTRAAGKVQFDWVTADEAYGSNGMFLDALEADEQRYVVEVPVSTTVWTIDPAMQVPTKGPGPGRPTSQPLRDGVTTVCQTIAALDESAWTNLCLREGAKGPVTFAFARVRVWAVRHRKAGPPIWLVARKSLTDPREVKYYVSNADETTPLATLALVGGQRWRVEEFFLEAKSELGLAHYEARSWTSWHHHVALVALAHLYLVQTKQDLKRDVPELTLPMAIRLVKAALEQPTLTVETAERLTEYHLARNQIAKKSHRKSWLKRHKDIQAKPLL